MLSTGDELVSPSTSPGPARFGDVNGPMLCALLEKMGAEPDFLGIVVDTEERWESALTRASITPTS